jgi:hypothetical protein
MARTSSIPLFFVIAVFAVNGFSQAAPAPASPPNFSGKWQLEDDAGGKRVMEISHTGDLLLITESFEHQKRTYSNKMALHTDRRGERNLNWIPGRATPAEVSSETYWKKGKLVRKSSYSLEAMDSRREWKTIVSERAEYTLSNDGDTYPHR